MIHFFKTTFSKIAAIMTCGIIAAGLIFPAASAFAVSCSLIGSTSYCSDGTSYSQIGNSIYGSDGTSYNQIGNTLYGSNGTSYTQIGNSIYGSNGTSYSQIGNSLYGSDGSTYSQIGNSIYGTGDGSATNNCPVNSTYNYLSSSCKCNSGYQANTTKDGCVFSPTPIFPAQSNDQVCSNSFGINSSWDGTKTAGGLLNCVCQSGYVWNTARTSCVAAAVIPTPQPTTYAPSSPVAGTDIPGTNISSNGTVYMITTDGQRRPYTSAGAFLSYGFNSWTNVVPASSVDLALPAGNFIPPRDGKIICSDNGSDKGTCYLITNSQKAAFANAAVFKGLGFNFSNSVNGDISFLPSAPTISNASQAHSAGVLINLNGTIYLVGDNGLLGIPDMNTLTSWGYSLTDSVKANAADSAMAQTGVMATHTPGALNPFGN